MTSKRTRAVRNRRPDELRAWSGLFRCGYDFFDAASEWTGLPNPIRVWPLEAQTAAEVVWLQAAEEAWQRLGAEFMATWQPADDDDPPWALEQFGAPPGLED